MAFTNAGCLAFQASTGAEIVFPKVQNTESNLFAPVLTLRYSPLQCSRSCSSTWSLSVARFSERRDPSQTEPTAPCTLHPSPCSAQSLLHHFPTPCSTRAHTPCSTHAHTPCFTRRPHLAPPMPTHPASPDAHTFLHPCPHTLLQPQPTPCFTPPRPHTVSHMLCRAPLLLPMTQACTNESPVLRAKPTDLELWQNCRHPCQTMFPKNKVSFKQNKQWEYIFCCCAV